MDDPFGRLVELTRQLSRSGRLEDAEQMRRATLAAQTAITEHMRAAATATDPTGLVAATVQVDGTVEGVHISAYAIRDLDHAQLELACADAIRAARAAAATDVTAWMTGGEGPGPSGHRPTGRDTR